MKGLLALIAVLELGGVSFVLLAFAGSMAWPRVDSAPAPAEPPAVEQYRVQGTDSPQCGPEEPLEVRMARYEALGDLLAQGR